MEEVKDPPADKNDSTTSSSSSIDMKEWDLLDPDIANLRKNSGNETKESELKPATSPSGLFMHTSSEHSGVEEIVAETETLHHYESNSSSDIDVIDECIEDGQGTISMPTMDISFCASDISSTMSASNQEITEQHSPVKDSENQTEEIPFESVTPSNQRTFFEKCLDVTRLVIDAVNAFQRDRMSLTDYFVLFSIISVCVILPISHIVIKKASWESDKLAQMEGHIDKLQSENIHLKNKVLSKIESGKLFGELDKEMRDLKAENLKLHKAMQTVIHQLEEQTHAIRKGIESREHKHPDSYKKEIAKFKEQINMLRIDNEELQTQLVRIRYGKHPNQQDYADKHEREKKGSAPEFSSEAVETDEKKDNTFDKRSEINEFRKKLNEEIAKLKNWEKLLVDFTKETENIHDRKGVKKEKFSDERNNYEKQENFKSKQKKHKSRKFYDWSWKEIQDNFKGTLESFPAVSDMISQYVSFDKQKVDGVLNSVSHYFKKAQDKTKEILESYSIDEKTQAVKDDIWTLFDEMKNKYINMKKEFMQSHFESDDFEKNDESEFTSFDENSNEEQVTEDAMYSHFNAKKYKGDNSYEIPTKESEGTDYTLENNELDDQHIFNPEEDSKAQENMDDMDEFNQLLKEAQQMIYDRESNLNTWMYERARHRAELRAKEDTNDDASNINWYLRKAKMSEETYNEETYENFYSAKNENE